MTKGLSPCHWAVAGGVVPGMRDYAPKTKPSLGKV